MLRVVIENGTYQTKVGLSSSVQPAFRAPPAVLSSSNSGRVPVYTAKGVRDHSRWESLCADLLLEQLKIDPSQKEFVVSEYALETQECRYATYESLFETFGASKVALVSEPVASLYSSIAGDRKVKGRPTPAELTCLLVDLGHTHSTVVPIIEGHVIENGIASASVTGKEIQSYITSEIVRLNPGFDRRFTSEELELLGRQVMEGHTSLRFLDSQLILQSTALKLEFLGKPLTLQLSQKALTSPVLLFEPV